MEIVQVYDDGWRLAAVVHRRRKYITLLVLGNLKDIELLIGEERDLRHTDVGAAKAKRYLKATQKYRKAEGKTISKKTKALLKELFLRE